MGYITEFAAFTARIRRRRGPSTLTGWFFFLLSVGAFTVAKNDDILAKFFENEALRAFLKILMYLVAAVFFAIAIAEDLKARN